jgi:hypothetical protein
MKSLRVVLAFGCVTVPIMASSSAPAQEATSDPASGVHDFDFLLGDWRAHHRRLRPDTRQWEKFEGTWSTRPLLGGAVNIEEHALGAPRGAYQALALRAYDSTTRQWAIWWLDGRYPSAIRPPVKGRFENGIGTFYSDYVQDGKPMKGRFLWSHITPTSARWEQAASADGGKTWAPNWIATLERDTARSTPEAAGATGVGDFDFLVGEWQVTHRFLRVKATGREWREVRGTARHRQLMGGRANLDEYTIDAPPGTYGALALRSFDPESRRWSIWWWDGRTPHADFDPPVQGRFEAGVGTFYGETRIDGKPVRVRFLWSSITPVSARWEQAYSSDGGATWERNWIMTFQRGLRPRT